MLNLNKPEGAEGGDGTDVATIYIYIVMLLEHHGTRLWGFLSKKSEWMDWIEWIPLREGSGYQI